MELREIEKAWDYFEYDGGYAITDKYSCPICGNRKLRMVKAKMFKDGDRQTMHMECKCGFNKKGF